MKQFTYIALNLFIVFLVGYMFGLYTAAHKIEHGPLLDSPHALKRAAHELKNPFTKELK